MELLSILQKYNVPVPRYTSYPTVPYWKTENTSARQWMNHVLQCFEKENALSLYVHLPYCESLCTYCGCNKHITKNHLVERPYINAVLKEWKMYTTRFPYKPKVKEIHFGGGTPTFFSAENLKYLVEGLLAAADIEGDVSFSFEAHPNSTTHEQLRVLNKLGFKRVSIGVQDFDAKIMKTINRHQTEEEVERVTAWARELGYAINYDLIYGLPNQTMENLRYNLKKIAQLKPSRIAFYSYAHVPGVAPGQRAYGEENLPPTAEKLQMYQMAVEELKNLGYQHIGMDHFALPHDDLSRSMNARNLHRNFMGYTHMHTELCIALGASAISDSWTAYAQNEKKLKNYFRRIKEEDLPPVVKNHFLTDAEQATRKLILELICNLEIKLEDHKMQLNEADRAQLLTLQKDGLIVCKATHLKVTERGRHFLRNICAVFDRCLQAEKLQKPTFSKAV